MPEWKSYSLVPGEIQPSELIEFAFDPQKPGGLVKVLFPVGVRTLTSDNLAELGVVFLALADKTSTANIGEILKRFDLSMPRQMLPSPDAKLVARNLLGVFINNFSQVKKLLSTPKLRIDMENKIAEGLACLERKTA